MILLSYHEYVIDHLDHSRISLAIMFKLSVTLLMSYVRRSKRALFLACSEKAMAYILLMDFRRLVIA